MKIGVIGTRGFPEVQGGLETHCMELYTRVAQFGNVNVTVYRRTPYINERVRRVKFPNIRFVDINVPKSKNLETFLHSFLATIHALFQGYDIIHFHNTGPGFFIPVLKLSGARIIFTYHNVSYTQKKWGGIAKSFLSLSEKIALADSDFIIFISEVLKSEMVTKYKIKQFRFIPNGVNIPLKAENSAYIESLGLLKFKYVIGVGRFLEEKGFDQLIAAFRKAEVPGYRLVLVGDTDYPTAYSTRLKEFAKENNVVLTGFIKGEKLRQIYTFARLFVISSFSEGLPIALLEAMSYNIDVIASDIPANLQIGLDSTDYFRAGDEDDLRARILAKLSGIGQKDYSGFLDSKYDWDRIAAETYNIYNKLLT